MICDEVMAGWGRTGKMFAFENFDVKPDIVTFAKGVTCGYVQLGGVVVSKRIAEYFDDHLLSCGLTYSVHPLACAVGVACVNYYKEANIVDDYTVKISLKKPALTLLNVLTSPCQFAAIMPEECVDARTNTGVKEYIGTGPMKFEEWKQDSYIRFTRNEDYKSSGYALTGEAGDKTVYYKEIYYYIVTDSSIRTAGIQSGEYDISQSISYDDLDALKANPQIKIVNNTVGNYAVCLDKKSGPFENEKVRQAAQYAVDVDEIVAVVVPNADYVDKYSSYMYKNGAWGTDSGSQYWNQKDTAEAKQLLAESGYDGTPIVMLSTTAYPTWVDGSLILKRQLEAVGFNVDLQVYDWATMLDMKKDPSKFDCALLWWPMATVPTALKLNQSAQDGWISFPEVTESFEKMNSAATTEEAKKVWSELNEFLLKTAS